MADSNITVAIVYSHRLCREALALALAQQDGITVSLESSCLDQFFESPRTVWPDLFLIAISHSFEECVRQVCRLRSIRPDCRVVIADVPDTSEAILACNEICGPSGYVLCNGSFDDVVRSIRAVASCGPLCSPRVTTIAFSQISDAACSPKRSGFDLTQYLTRREQGIVELIEKGLSNKEIAVRLGIEVSTVKNHVHNILDKLNLQDRHSAVRYVKEHGVTVQFS